ncbi:aldehyde reductase ii [Trichoderma arundinaceum]|uniref:Aldehyde reductase ii n=1 Tax=Trichoderma arundinaceum TaxID=490622 RepID=A0A395NN19_TRIAR|nr:aldehyde reductase ii [Trichoderma arundinaceum]
MKIENPAIPFNSIVVIIGANGYIGTETCEKFLQAGYRVRGTVRDVEKHQAWMHNLFDDKYPGKFELVRVVDFEADDGFDKAFEGAAGVVYVSTPIIFDPDPANVVDPVVKGIINTLNSAVRAGVKRYVLCSSSKAVEATVYNQPHEISTETYNHEDLRKAYEEPTVATTERALSVYSASRVAAELAFWSWVKENNPPFVANCIVLDGNFGRVLRAEKIQGSSVGMLKRVLAGNWNDVLTHLAYIVNVEDSARLMVAAATLSSIVNERIFAYYKQATWNELRHKIRQLYPDRLDLVSGEDLDLEGRDMSNADGPIKRAEEILKGLGQSGFMSVDDTLRDLVDTFCS